MARRGLRRGEPEPSRFDWQSGLPTGTSNRSVVPPPQGEVGLVGGEATSSAHPGAGRGTVICTNYEDRASVPKPQTGLVNSKVPFTLKR